MLVPRETPFEVFCRDVPPVVPSNSTAARVLAANMTDALLSRVFMLVIIQFITSFVKGKIWPLDPKSRDSACPPGHSSGQVREHANLSRWWTGIWVLP